MIPNVSRTSEGEQPAPRFHFCFCSSSSTLPISMLSSTVKDFTTARFIENVRALHCEMKASVPEPLSIVWKDLFVV